MKYSSNRGFTLIELLVVIAIIGILSSVVLASLNTARTKGADASIKSNLNGIRSQAELYYDSNGNTYGTLATTSAAGACSTAATGVFSDTNVKAAVTAAEAQAGTATLNGVASSKVICGSTPGYWQVAVVLKSDSSRTMCIDSTGRATTTFVSVMDGASEWTTGCN